MFLKIFFGHVSPFCQVRVVPCSLQKQHSEFSVIIQIYSLATWWMLHNWRFIQHQTCFEHWQIFQEIYLNKYSSAGEPCLHKELPPGQDTSCFFWMNSKKHWCSYKIFWQILKRNTIHISNHMKSKTYWWNIQLFDKS